MSNNHKEQLEKQLWNIATLLRGKVSADDYRDYILGFIFYKYLSERQLLFANSLLKKETIKDYLSTTNKSILDAIKQESLDELGYFLLPNQLYNAVVKKATQNSNDRKIKEEYIESYSNTYVYIIDDLISIFNYIEQSTVNTASEKEFNGLFEDIDLTSTKLGRTIKQRNEIIVSILLVLNKIDFQLEDTSKDVLGDAYEYLISKFAAGAGKSAGEFYTPQEVSKILAKLVTTGKTKLKTVYDPTCGSGSLLLRVAKEVKEVGGFYGQELNRTTYNLARMNMILHGKHYSEVNIEQDDTLVNPLHIEHKFEAIVANPPFSAHWSGDKNPLNESDERFCDYGKLAPKTKADYAFIQHMIYHLDDNGIMATVVPHGVLFRGSSEGTIRKYLIQEKNYLDAVIGLPGNIFYGTSIPTCILVFKKCRRDNNILFIDASQEGHFIKEGNQNKLREEDITEIIDTYRSRQPKDKYAYVASLDEIKENEYNLNIPRYVDTFEEEEPIDLDAVAQQLIQIENELEETNQEILKYCQELNIVAPFKTNDND